MLARLAYPAELLVAAIVHKAWFQNKLPDQGDIGDGSSCVGVGRFLGSYEYRARRRRADTIGLLSVAASPKTVRFLFMRQKPVIWVDQLTLVSLYAGVKLAIGAGGAQLEYLHTAPWLSKLLRQFGLSSLVRPLDYNLGELRTPEGLGLRFALDAEIIAELPRRLDTLGQVSGFIPNQMGLDFKRMRLYLTKAAAEVVTPAVKLAYLAGLRQAEFGPPPLLLIGRDAAELCIGWPCLQGFVVRTYGRHPRTALGRGLAVAAHFLRAIFHACVWHARGITTSSPTPSKPQIGVELLDANDPADVTFYPWYPGSGIAADQISIINHRPDTKITRGRASTLRGQGHNWINMRTFMDRQSAVGRWQVPYLCDGWAVLLNSFGLLWHITRFASPLELWAAGQHLNLIWSVSYWEAFFRRHNIVAFTQTSDTGVRILAQAIAIDRAGGISFSTHGSHYPLKYPGHASDYTVYFSWGPYYRRIFEHVGWIVNQLVYCGHISHTGIPSSSIMEQRKRLMECGAQQIVCYFDHAYGSDLHYSRQMNVSLYQCLLAEVMQDLQFGLLVKPRGAVELQALTELREPLARAQATGRCIVLDPRFSPRDAALAADCVIGAGFNSAVVQAVTAGRPGLYADLSGHQDNDFHKWGDGIVAFMDLDSLMTAVRIRLADGAASVIGDHSPVLQQIDPFCDGAGARRMGWYLHNYITSINAGIGRDEALSRAKRDYQEQFGEDKVATLSPGS